MTAALFDDEIDAALDDVARRFAASEYNFEKRHRLDGAARRFSADTWASLADMGWFGVAIPEDQGGLGLRPSSIVTLAEIAGGMFLSEPLIEAFLGAYLIDGVGSREQQEEWFPRIVDGTLRLAMALEPAAWLADDARAVTIDDRRGLNGSLPFVVGADIADMMMLRVARPDGGSAVFAVDTASDGVEIAPYPLVDGRGAARVTLVGAVGQRLGDPDIARDAALDAALVLGALATAADSLGVMSRALDTTVEYLKTRVQFGRPIGTNQTLQHRAVDMQVQVGEARAVVSAAVHAGDLGTPAFAHAAHAAKAIIDVAARKVAHETIQLHGGIGMADEHVAGQCLRRVMVSEQIYGRRRDHMRQFAAGLSDDLDLEGVN